jgi:hypothetical protein
MKVAYIFHGHARTWDKAYQNFFNNVYSVVPGDIFIHTWDTTNPAFGSWWNSWNDLNEEQLAIANKTPDFSGIYEAYKPKILMIEKNKEPDFTNYPDYPQSSGIKSHLGVKSMLESSRKAFEAARNYGDYDKFFSTRLDLNYISLFDKDEFYSDKIMAANGGAFDLWMMGNLEQMDIKTQYFNHIDEYFFSNINSTPYEDSLKLYLISKEIKDWQSSKASTTIPRVF